MTAGALVKKAFPTVTVSVLDSKDGSVRSLRSSVLARHSERREAACVAASQYHSTYIRTALHAFMIVVTGKGLLGLLGPRSRMKAATGQSGRFAKLSLLRLSEPIAAPSCDNYT